jgi:asparagine synthase (glutamine-hydrolysing)
VCGIVGAYDVGAVDDRCLAAMSEAIAHRGPDAVGAWSGPGDPLGCGSGTGACRSSTCRRRPTSRSSRTGWALVFCGEIDNYRELKAELGAAGTGFRTDSDTEVLLEAWRRWGPGSLRRLRGTFASPVRRAPGHAHPGP